MNFYFTNEYDCVDFKFFVRIWFALSKTQSSQIFKLYIIVGIPSLMFCKLWKWSQIVLLLLKNKNASFSCTLRPKTATLRVIAQRYSDTIVKHGASVFETWHKSWLTLT